MRHPDDIKKSVKKNGTYMLKRAKMELKNGKPITTDSTSISAAVSKKNTTNKAFDEDELEDESLKDEAIDDDNEDDEVDDDDGNASNRNRKVANKNDNVIAAANDDDDDDSGLDETSTVSPLPEKKQKLNNENNTNHSESQKKKVTNSKKKIINIDNKQQQQQSSLNNQTTGLNQHFYPNLYPFLTAQMAAAAVALQQQQPQQHANHMFNRGTNNDEVLAAHFLMQLRNQNSNEFGQLNLENVTNKLAAAAAAANNSQTAAAVQLNLQQIFSNSNESFLNQRNSIKQAQLVKQEEVVKSNSDNLKQIKLENDVNMVNDGDCVKMKSSLRNTKSNNNNRSSTGELPLNLCVNNKKHKPNGVIVIKNERTSYGENQENNKEAKQQEQNEIDEKNIE